MLRADGRVIFWTMPDEKFRYSITSDALETKIVLENRTSKQKWECSVDDKKMKQSGPESVQLPRHVILSYLADVLKSPTDSPHRIMLQLEDQECLSLTLTLVFGPMFAPTYTLLFVSVPISKEERLEAQIADLQEEMDELRQEVASMRTMLQTQSISTSTSPMNEPKSQNVSPNSRLSARAPEFVFNKPFAF